MKLGIVVSGLHEVTSGFALFVFFLFLFLFYFVFNDCDYNVILKI